MNKNQKHHNHPRTSNMNCDEIILEEILWEEEIYGSISSEKTKRTSLKLTKEEEERKAQIQQIIKMLMDKGLLKEWWDYDD